MDAAPFDDRGLTLGDGLFETVLADRGRLVLFDEHIARMTAGCAALGLPAPNPPPLRAAALTALEVTGLARARAAVRLTWTAGSGGRGLERPAAIEARLVVAASPAPRPAGPARLALAAIRRNRTSPTSRLKTLAYLDNVLARQAALAAGADEALMLNTAGELASAAAANLFWIREGRLFTPSLQCGVLDGIVRAQVLQAARAMGVTVIEACEPATALASADAAFITNSLIGLRPVAWFEGRSFGASPLTERLALACAPAID